MKHDGECGSEAGSNMPEIRTDKNMQENIQKYENAYP